MSTKYFLTSTSDIKKCALQSLLGPDTKLECIDTSSCNNPEQPVGNLEGMICCKNRILWVLENQIFDHRWNIVIFSIENAIETRDGKCYDVVHVMKYDFSEKRYSYSFGGNIEFPMEFWEEAKAESYFKTNQLGWPVTIGEIYNKHFNVNPKDWISHVKKGYNRQSQITHQLTKLFSPDSEFTNDDFRANVKYIFDYPKPNILFKDISPLLSHSGFYKQLIKRCVYQITHQNKGDYYTPPPIDQTYMVGLESRGFILASAISQEMSCGFAMVRKGGKLPPPTVSADYVKEYGKDTFEMSLDAFPKHSPAFVWLIDDLLATGGSLACAIKLIDNLNEKRDPNYKIIISGCLTILQVDALKDIACKTLQGKTLQGKPLQGTIVNVLLN